MIRRQAGSVKRGIVATDMQDERAKLAFDNKAMTEWMAGGPAALADWKHMIDTFGADDALRNTVEFYDKTPHEQQEDLWKRINVLYQKHKKRCFEDTLFDAPYTDWNGYFQGLLPGIGLTITMFRLSVANLANEEQIARWMPRI